jgi:thiamine biosynthesis lipoprotein
MFKESRVLMDTFCTITVVSPSKEMAKDVIDAGFAEIKKLELLLNYFSVDSEITEINNAAGIKPIKVSDETLEIMNKTREISQATTGAFDPTIAPVVKEWKFSKDKSTSSVPSKTVVEKALRLVDFRKITIDKDASEVFLQEKGMELDLGGIAKGYAADKAVDTIRAKGIKAALVAIAGDIRGFGLNPSGQGWKVGIQNPRPSSESEKPWEDIFAVLHLKDKAISTSGDYQRFFIKDGKRYHHILDPETGFSADSGLISVSVIAPVGYLADSLSTAAFVLGAEKGMKLLESMEFDGVFVDADKKILLTKNLRRGIKLLSKKYRLAN